MNTDAPLEDQVSAWLAEASPGQIPDRLLRTIVEDTRGVSQERALFRWRLGTVSRNILIAAAASLTIAVALIIGYRSSSDDSGRVGGTPVTPTAAASPSSVPASPAPITGLPGRFAFAANRTGNFEIYTMKPDGSELAQLTSDPADDREPAWSPDGTTIAFTRSEPGGPAIWTMHADGSAPKRLAQGGTPQWAPDGSRLVGQTGAMLFTIAPDGTNQVSVSDEATLGLLISSPTWSADPDHIVFVGAEADGKASDLYSVGIDGTNLTKLTTTPADDASPRVSPDGTLIAFQTHDRCICTISAGGVLPRQLADWRGKGGSLSWSPDGRWIASAGGPHGGLFIHVISADDGEDRIASTTSDFVDISWGP
jgi:dipeptidyl aminopeptidase/acylaminoacyl peptidase